MNYYTKDSIVEYFIDTHTFHFTNNILVKLFNKIGFEIINKDERSDITYYLKKTETKNFLKNNKRFFNKKIGFFDRKNALLGYKKNLIRNRKKLQNFGKNLDNKYDKVLFWGAGRIFDGLFKYGKIKKKSNYKLYDKHLNKYFKKFYNLKILDSNQIKKLKNFNVVICSNSEYSQIFNEAKSYKFTNILSYESLLK